MLAPRGFEQEVEYWLAFIPEAFARGEMRVWSLLTYALLHASLFHVLMNAAMLLALGSFVERTVGATTFLTIFCLCTIGGALMFWAFDGGAMIGASGGVAGLFGTAAVLLWRRRSFDPRARSIITVVAIILALNVGMALLGGGGVAWQAHIGGLAAGVVYGYAVLDRRPPGGGGGGRRRPHLNVVD
ncbi:MAG: rhomboid family intramembrane serine protease [Pseudomonadota bacterium]|nr:rhomboid family intramembrane serine protease [Pseudomonadota bacterium]